MLSYKDDEISDIYDYIFRKIFLSYCETIPIFQYSKSFHSFMQKLDNLDIDQDIITQSNKQKEFTSIHNVCESIIILTLLKEKFAPLKGEKFSQVAFFRKIITKHINATKKDYHEDQAALFRKDDLSNLLIKYAFLAFGNHCFIMSFYNPFKAHLEFFKEKVTVEKFESFFHEFISKLTMTFPKIIKILLKIIKVEIEKNYKEKNDSPMFTTLIFNFFISPKVQDIYGIGMNHYKFIKDINKIFRNICFGMNFNEQDALAEFNVVIQKCHQRLIDFIRDEIYSKVEIAENENSEEIDNFLGQVLDNKNIIVPQFLFEFDWKVVSSIFKLNNETMIAYMDVEVKHIKKSKTSKII